MTKEFIAGEQAERARSTQWLRDRAESFESLAHRQQAMHEPTAAINAAYARAFRSALAHVTAGEQPTPQPTATP